MQRTMDNRAVNLFIAGLIFLLPVTMATVEHSASTIFGLLFLMGLVWGWPEWKNLQADERHVLYAGLIFFAAATLSLMNSDDMSKSISRLERLLRFVGVVPIYLLLRQLKLDALKYLQWGVVVAGPVVLWSSIVDIENGRADGAYNAILFGNFTILIAVFSLAIAIICRKQRWLLLLALISMAGALYASVMSLTRGSWLAFPVAALVVLAHFLYTSNNRRDRLKRFFLATLLLAGGLFVATNSTIVHDRMVEAGRNLVQFASGGDGNTAVGERLLMWEISYDIWQKNPMIGSGLGDYFTDMKQIMAAGETTLITAYGEAHSIYFEFLATTGLLGLITMLLALIVLPLRFFTAAYVSRRDDMHLFAPVAGVLLVLTFAVFGIGQNWAGRSSISSVYVVLLALLMVSTNRQKGLYER